MIDFYKQKSFFTIIIFFSFFTLSCNKNEDNEAKPKELIKVSFPEHHLYHSGKLWLLLSDETGKVINYLPANSNSDVIFEIPNSYDKETKFNLTEIFVYQQDGIIEDFNLTTFTGIKGGEYWYSSLPESTPITGSAKINVNNYSFEQRPDFTVDGDAYAGITSRKWFPNSDGFSVDFNLDKDKGFLFTTLTNKDELNADPLYYYIPEISVGQTIEVEASQFQPLINKGFAISDGISANVSLNGYTSDNFSDDSYRVYNKFYFNDESPNLAVELFYPGSLFPFYSTSFNYRQGNNTYSYVVKANEPVLDSRKINAAVNSLKQTGKTLELEMSGSYDYSVITSQLYEEYSTYIWEVICPSGNKTKVNLPEIPSELLNQYSKLAAHDFKFTTGYVTERDEVEGYEDYLKRYFQPNPSGNKVGIERRSLEVDFDTNGSGFRSTNNTKAPRGHHNSHRE